MPEVGLEPTRPLGQEILSLSWLPITPLAHGIRLKLAICLVFGKISFRRTSMYDEMIFCLQPGAVHPILDEYLCGYGTEHSKLSPSRQGAGGF